ncbi:MAG: hypothetical protein WBB34_10580, partial [Xanthobacteraceae bacterium]
PRTLGAGPYRNTTNFVPGLARAIAPDLRRCHRRVEKSELTERGRKRGKKTNSRKGVAPVEHMGSAP